MVGEALSLGESPETFDVGIDSGLFHVFADARRAEYEPVLRLGGVLHLMCFCENAPGDWEPRRVRAEELRQCFSDGWVLDAIDDERFDLGDGSKAAARLMHARRA